MINIGGGAMPKVRIYELAKMLKIENKELIEKLKELGIDAKSHMSVLTEEDAAVVMEMFDTKQDTITAQEKTEQQGGIYIFLRLHPLRLLSKRAVGAKLDQVNDQHHNQKEAPDSAGQADIVLLPAHFVKVAYDG